jgi:hypothetical protein
MWYGGDDSDDIENKLTRHRIMYSRERASASRTSVAAKKAAWSRWRPHWKVQLPQREANLLRRGSKVPLET